VVGGRGDWRLGGVVGNVEGGRRGNGGGTEKDSVKKEGVEVGILEGGVGKRR